MKYQKYLYRYACLLSLVLIYSLTTSCIQKGTDPSVYVKGLSDIATQYNKNCPKNEANGTTLQSVTFTDSTLRYRYTLSDQAIVTINLDNTRDSIIHNMTDKLRKFLVKGNCKLECKYVSPNDSSSITIVPKELGDVDSDE